MESHSFLSEIKETKIFKTKRSKKQQQQKQKKNHHDTSGIVTVISADNGQRWTFPTLIYSIQANTFAGKTVEQTRARPIVLYVYALLFLTF